jgi:predicted RNA polymerase sigma factor
MIGIQLFGGNIGTFILQFTVLAILIEAVVNAITKVDWKNKSIIWATLTAYAISTVVILNTHTGIFEAVGFTWAVPFIDWLFTGIVLSRGSNFVHDLITSIQKVGGHNEVGK